MLGGCKNERERVRGRSVEDDMKMKKKEQSEAVEQDIRKDSSSDKSGKWAHEFSCRDIERSSRVMP